jgi:hypothetical protein
MEETHATTRFFNSALVQTKLDHMGKMRAAHDDRGLLQTLRLVLVSWHVVVVVGGGGGGVGGGGVVIMLQRN